MAIEGATFVICSSQILTEEGLKKDSILAGNPVTKVVRQQVQHFRLVETWCMLTMALVI